MQISPELFKSVIIKEYLDEVTIRKGTQDENVPFLIEQNGH
jgi:hypothetical protein